MGLIRSTEPDFLPGTLEMLILQTLSRGSNHGYGIAQHIQQVSDDALKIGEGSLYPALQRLLSGIKAGKVQTRLPDRPGDRNPQHVPCGP